MLVAVTSKSTEDYDRGDKLSHYKQIDSVRSVVIVSHASKRLTVVARTPGGSVTTDYRASEVAVIASPALTLGVDEIYSVLVGL